MSRPKKMRYHIPLNQNKEQRRRRRKKTRGPNSFLHLGKNILNSLQLLFERNICGTGEMRDRGLLDDFNLKELPISFNEKWYKLPQKRQTPANVSGGHSKHENKLEVFFLFLVFSIGPLCRLAAAALAPEKVSCVLAI